MAKTLKFITQYSRSGLEKYDPIPPEDEVNRQISDDCEINKIFENYSPGDSLPIIQKDLSDYNENISFADLTQARELLDSAEAEFMSLPSSVRKEFGNDLFAYSASLSQAYSGNELAAQKLSDLGLLKPLGSTIDSATSQSGGNVSVITPPDDSKNSTSGSNSSTVNQSQNTPPVNNAPSAESSGV